jgi:uncharacterized membrane protein (DUF2068 family)
VVRLIVLERLVKGSVLTILAVSLIVFGRAGLLTRWAVDAQADLNLDVGRSLIERLIDEALVRIGLYRHVTLLGAGVILYALLELTEGVGLALRRRWAEYLTVIATGVLIPFEIWEVAHRLTLLRAGSLLVNVAVVGYLGYRKRLFVSV